jgi:hypothetical protein
MTFRTINRADQGGEFHAGDDCRQWESAAFFSRLIEGTLDVVVVPF